MHKNQQANTFSCQFLFFLVCCLIGFFLVINDAQSDVAGQTQDRASSVTSPSVGTKASRSNCQVVINEFMSARQRVLADEDGDYSDWIELYNCTDKDIDLEGWYLSDRYDMPLQWQFPAVQIPAQGYLIVWASGKDKIGLWPSQATKEDKKKTHQTAADVGQTISLHTNFSIAAEGEPLLLSDPTGQLMDEVAAIELDAHETAGRSPDGVGEFVILTAPTPAAANASMLAPAWLEAPTFSHESGFYDEEFALVISHPDEEVEIYYTLDGSEPDPDNLEGSTYRYKNSYQQPPTRPGQKVTIKDNFLYNEYISHKYQGPITIKDRTYEPDRISQISTTFDEKPDYFPQPELEEHWINDVVYESNRVIKEINRGIRSVNKFGNKVLNKITGKKPLEEADELQFGRTFVLDVPEISYRKYTNPKRYTFKGTPVRALAVKEANGRQTKSEMINGTFFIGDREQFTLPIVAITVPEKELFDYDEGIFVAGKSYDDWLKTLDEPQLVRAGAPTNWRKGKGERDGTQKRKGAIEVIFSNSPSQQILIGPHGNWSRANRQKSIRVYPIENENININIYNLIFNERDHKDDLVVNLRSGGYSPLGGVRKYDAVAHLIAEGLSIGTQSFKPFNVFINGEYFGLLNARDRKDYRYISNYYGADREALDLLKQDNKVQEGSSKDWLSFLESIEGNNDSLEYLYKENIDIESFMDFYALGIFIARTDWPSNNNSWWRCTDEAKCKTDRLWRWLLYDNDSSLRRVEFNMLEYLTSANWSIDNKPNKNPPWATFLYRNFIKVDAFRERFIIRLTDLLNTTFSSSRITNIVNGVKNKTEDTVQLHLDRWNSSTLSRSYSDWRKTFENMYSFSANRPTILRQHLQEFFDLGDLYTLAIDMQVADGAGNLVSADKAAIIHLNTLALGVSDDELEKPVAASARATNMEEYLALPWSGQYFADMPITLSVTPRPGYRFSHWEGVDANIASSSSLALNPAEDISIIAVMERVD